jgi:DeoR/GlpR family transcriptional regulator of sugar metabolism
MGQNKHKDRQGRTLLADARRSAIADLVRANDSVTVAELERQFGISSMTARRDLAELERQGLARRTHGGAVMPSITAHEDSFASRMDTATDAKLALASAAAALVAPGESIFLDSSTTAYHVARALVDRGIDLTLITNSVPIMELVSSQTSPGVDLVGVGGALRTLTRSFVGPHAVHTILGHYADRLLFSVKGVTADGALTDADPLEAEVKRAMMAHAQDRVLLVDRTKLSARGLAVIGHVADLTSVMTYGMAGDELAPLTAPGVDLEVLDAGVQT